MIKKTADRRVVRTKKMLRDALAELIEDKGFEAITVCDLTERADINRGTFYAHYKDKTDLLVQSENDLIEAVLEIQSGLVEMSMAELLDCYVNNKPLPFAVALYRYLGDNGRFVRALIGPKGDPGFTPRLKEVIARNILENVLSEKYRENMTPLTKYYMAYYTSAQLGVIEHWFESGMNEDPEEMARIVLSIMFMRPGDAIEMRPTILDRVGMQYVI
ncbi:MAG: TetR/AcrR family transcriptional regulator [Actinobacteria bacterium]|nr:TetR/AcrR family transcriptional regulator [Actinomycetota bacterium]